MTETQPEPVRILLVDDDEVDRMAVVRALRDFDGPLEISEVASAEAAAERIDEEAFDCVLSDLHMPGRDGAWLLRTMRELGVDTPFVALTGQGDELTAVAMMKAGAADYIVKGGATAARLAQTLRHVIRVHRAECDARRSEQALRRSEERLRMALDVTGLGTWDVDVESRLFECDERCRVLFGLPPAPAYALEDGYANFHPDDVPAVRASLTQAMLPGGDGRWSAEFRVLGPGDGPPRWLRSTGQTYFQDGRPTRMVGTVLDISASRRELEGARRRAEFEQQLIGIVSHDLRNPISAMMMGATLMVRRLPADSPLAAPARRILSSGERAARLIRDLLDFTQARSASGIPIQRNPADIHTICQQAVDEATVNHPDRTLVHQAEGDGAGLWDPDRLAQVLGNLIVNAASYSPPDSQVLVVSRGLADSVVIEVRNQGPPIADDMRATLFEPFKRHERRKDPERSIGLGLFIVRQIVAAHGGAVRAASSNGETVFRVELPRSPRPEDPGESEA